jgi:hypothetical protein
MKTPPVGDELFHADGQTDRHDEADSRFPQFFANAPKNVIDITGNYTRPVELQMIDGFGQEGIGKSLDPELTHQEVARLF